MREKKREESLRGDWSGLESDRANASIFLAFLVLEAGVRFAAGVSPVDLVADFRVAAFRVLITDMQ